MHELLKLVLLYLHSMWQYRWYAMLLSWLVALAIWGFVFTLPNQYEGHTRIYIDTESVLKPLLNGLAVQTNVMNEVSLMTNALKSRPNLERVIQETDLGHRVNSQKEIDDMISLLEQKITISRGSNNLFQISYKDQDRKVAGMVVQNLLDSLMENTRGANRTDATSAQNFLEKQIGEYEKRLADAEQRLAEFKQKNAGLMPSQGEDYYSRLQQAVSTLEHTESSLAVAVRRHREIEKQLAGEEPVFLGLSTPTTETSARPTDPRIAEYESKLDQMLLKYTDEHPDVINLRQTLEQLKQKQKAEAKAAPAATRGDFRSEPVEMNPVYQQMQTALNESNIELETLRGQRDQEARKVERLKELVNAIPEVEAELTRLNRDYNVTKTQYDTLLQRLETARLSEEADRSNEDVEFRIIDPVNVPLDPSGPPRTLFLLAGAGIGLAAGLGLAFLLIQIRPVFIARESLSEILALPVLGSVSMVRTTGQRIRRRFELVSFIFATGFLFVAVAGAIYFQDSGMRIAQALIR